METKEKKKKEEKTAMPSSAMGWDRGYKNRLSQSFWRHRPTGRGREGRDYRGSCQFKFRPRSDQCPNASTRCNRMSQNKKQQAGECWSSSTPDSWAQYIVLKGYKIDPNPFMPCPVSRSKAHRHKQAIQHLLDIGAVEEWFTGIYSTLFMVPKKLENGEQY